MLCRFAVVISAAHVVPGVVEVVALLGCMGGLCCSSAIRVIIGQVAAAVEHKPGPAAQPHGPVNFQRKKILNLNIDIAPMTEDFFYNTPMLG